MVDVISVSSGPVQDSVMVLDQTRTSLMTCVGMSLLAGISTTLGAGVVFVLPGHRVSPGAMAFVLALAGGVMLSVTILEFWVPMLIGGKEAVPVFQYSALGAAAFFVLSWFVPEPEMVEDPAGGNTNDEEAALAATSLPSGQADLGGALKPGDGHVHPSKAYDDKGVRQRSWRLATVLMLALTAHNFPEGFAVAISALESRKRGFIVMFAIAIHNIPEGIAIAVPVLDATGSRWKALWMSFLSGMAEPLGALFALWLVHVSGGSISDTTLDNLLCAVGGIMSAVALKELLPEAYHQRRPTFAVAGVSAGFLIMWLTIHLGA